MTDPDALLHTVAQAFNTVASTVGLPQKVKSRVLRQMERHVRAYAYTNSELEDFPKWIEEELADLLANECIRPLCRITLAAWFAREVANWLSGDFDNVA